ncbi:LpxI family protein [Vampirovibrio chlorellavorus]|uniref:LpxI family protein n=1 Tax=Vampirovibrio chlorellavorus TaxID=758823 RepID=UPI0026EE4652|nr:UDP-2,3-diacylglucosamine diphosphatase LpxI [Vampirovibrio chlorellavorus]
MIGASRNIMETRKSVEFGNVTRIGLIAGEGLLPRYVAKNARIQGIEVVPFIVGKDNPKLRDLCKHKGHRIVPGLVRRTLDLITQERITHLVFAGKVDKWVLLKDPRIDDIAVEAIRQYARLNDDAVMLWIIEQLEQRGIQVLPQADFLRELFLPEKILTERQPTEADLRDARYGFEMAKEMGRLDIGQSIVVHSGMILAVEAIEGTDECLKRAGKLSGKKGGVVIKVAKPDQDQRFDIPTVGLRTLKTMRKAGLHMLVTEANQTLYLEPEEMETYANRHNMIILSTQDPRHDR